MDTIVGGDIDGALIWGAVLFCCAAIGGGAMEGILATGGAEVISGDNILVVDREGGAVVNGGWFSIVGGTILVVCANGAPVGIIGGAADIVGTGGVGCDITGGGLNSVGDGIGAST